MRNERQHKLTESHDETDRYAAEDAAELEKGAFDGSSIGRRTFLSVAAATGAALALPRTVSAEVTDDAMTDLAEFAVNAAPNDHQVTLVIEFEDTVALHAFYDEYGEPDWDIEEDDLPPKAVTREKPTPAAHAYLTADELTEALDLGGIDFVDFSPGANPFWKLGDAYDDHVFPEVEDARDFVSHNELDQGFQYLADEYSDRLRVHAIGQSPGWENLRTGEDPDPKDVYVAEIMKNIQDEESFAEKDKVVFSLSIHGDEPAGRVAGTRIIEEAAKGTADDFEDVLDDIVIVFVFINPDGWVVRKPQYEFETWWGGTERFRYHRGNAAVGDTNRQYPTMGWVYPGYWPAEPEDTPEVRPDDPEGRGYEDMVPDALAVVEHLRGYDNVEYLCDYHMMDLSESMVLNLESNAPYNHDGTHNLDEVNIRIGDGMQDHWGSPETISDDTSRASEAIYGIEGYVPERLLDYGTIYDSLSYQITGGLLGWAGQPEEFGGLGAVTVAPELVLRDGYDWKPFIERRLEMAYRISMREYTEMTAAKTNATVATDGQDTAYVGSDVLTRRSADLPYTDESPGKGDGKGQDRATRVQRRHETVQPGPGGSASASSGRITHSLAVQFDAHGIDEGVVRLVNPGGQTVREIDLADPLSDDQGHFYVPDPDDGDWSIEYDGDTDIDVEMVLLETEGEYPNPEEVLGYSQREYVVNPMQFFEDLEPFLEEGTIDGLRVHDVRIGRLMRGNSGKRRYDNLVISHDDGVDDQRYVSAIEEFVETGGDLVLTDAGLNLLGRLDVGQAAAIEADDIEFGTTDFPNLMDRDLDHPLLTDVRPIQQEIWKISQLGYTTGDDSPVWTVDTDAFTDAGGTIAGILGEDGDVGAGLLSAGDAEINVIGSVLPPANQRELHPFGMADYTLSFMGHTLMCNALGFEQRRYVNGELVGTWGELR
ncbi:M14 family zinc carboxypeptidase [Haladaptatus halobius]|uniref:M14 family zinc carboxypeptidase n=1 Tax=Haladaptatus halobius TaxID=2884875 RepID=UPI001D0B7152|nr:M14 family zinc carboxypeptidase [Haladaptatus halobius]